MQRLFLPKVKSTRCELCPFAKCFVFQLHCVCRLKAAQEKRFSYPSDMNQDVDHSIGNPIKEGRLLLCSTRIKQRKKGKTGTTGPMAFQKRIFECSWVEGASLLRQRSDSLAGAQ